MESTTFKFTLLINGLNRTEKISVRILDLQGRIVEQHTNINPIQKLTIGNGFRSGVYFAEIHKELNAKSSNCLNYKTVFEARKKRLEIRRFFLQ